MRSPSRKETKAHKTTAFRDDSTSNAWVLIQHLSAFLTCGPSGSISGHLCPWAFTRRLLIITRVRSVPIVFAQYPLIAQTNVRDTPSRLRYCLALSDGSVMVKNIRDGGEHLTIAQSAVRLPVRIPDKLCTWALTTTSAFLGCCAVRDNNQ